MPLPPVPAFQDPALAQYLKALNDALQHDLYAPVDDNGGVGVNQSGVDVAIQAAVAPLQDALAAGLAIAAPPGMIVAHDGTTAPTGWLACDGSEVPKDTYAALYQVLGGRHGETATHFTLPDLRDRGVRGASATRPLGSTGGADVVPVPLLEHTHTYDRTTTASQLVDTPVTPTLAVLGPPVTQTPTDTAASGDPAPTVDVTNRYGAYLYCIKT